MKGIEEVWPSDSAQREGWEHQKHQAELDAINALTNELKAQRQEASRSEQLKSRRENMTIVLVCLTLIATAYGDYIFHQTMQDARVAASKAHDDSSAALRSANTASRLQHADTVQALDRARIANAISSDTARRQLRAYLEVEMAGLHLDRDGVWRAYINIKNAGQTPAHSVSVAWRMTNMPANISQSKIDRLLAGAKSNPEMFYLAPGVTRGATNNITAFTAPIQAELFAGRQFMYVCGVVRYVDIFDQPQRVTFCHAYGGPKWQTEDARYYRYGNSAT